jgi:signal transduction histidine kinase
LTASYLAIFVAVIATLSIVAFVYVDRSARDALQPLLSTPEGAATLARYERARALSFLLIDAGLALGVGVASFALARTAVRPLALAREREERFAADVAHELRTPLSVIASVAQAARDGARSNEERAAFATIARRALESGELISDLLTLARKGGTDVLDTEPVDLSAIAQRVARELASVRPDVVVETHLASAIVDGDERRLAQLSRNLIANAIRYARSRVDVAVTTVDGRWAQLSVEDDGSGVAAEMRAHLFGRFAKGHDSAGSGLGLAICRWVARAHGGEIALESGSRFVATFPLGRYGVDDAPGSEN